MKVPAILFAGLILGSALSISLGAPVRPAAAADVSIRMDMNGVAQFLFDTEPRLVIVPNTHVYYAQDVPTADVYRVNSTWYSFYKDGWYQSDGYRGTWTRCAPGGLPQDLDQVPNGYSRFTHPARGDRGGRNDADAGYLRGPGGSHARDVVGNDGRNADGTFTHNESERYSRNPDGNYSRDMGGSYNRNADGSFTRNDGERYALGADGAYTRHPEGGFYRNGDGSYVRRSEDAYNGQGGRDPGVGYDRRDGMRDHDGSMIQISQAPRMYAIPRTQISYAKDYRGGELYQSGSDWYINYHGDWYGSAAYSGPWTHVETGHVPGGISNAPRGFYRSLGTRAATTRAASYAARHPRRKHHD